MHVVKTDRSTQVSVSIIVDESNCFVYLTNIVPISFERIDGHLIRVDRFEIWSHARPMFKGRVNQRSRVMLLADYNLALSKHRSDVARGFVASVGSIHLA